MLKNTLYSLIIGFLISGMSFSQTTTSDNFVFCYANSNLKSGLYLVLFKGKKGNLTKKLIVE